MTRITRGELLYSSKCLFASMLALFLALKMGLPRPFWAMMTAYVVASPLSGTVRSKAVYRLGGTFLGSSVTVLMVPPLANAPELLSLALACWVGVCLYISLLDRTPRAYVFMLAGYTAGLIGFPVVTDPGSVLEVALARVEEIGIGILCATLVHSLVFPQSLGPVLLARIDRAIKDARNWMRAALVEKDGSDRAAGAPEHRNHGALAGDITELRLMATHLPFDTSHLRWTSGAIHALQDRLALMVPALSAIEDRLHALRQLGALAPAWHVVLLDIVRWSRQEEQIGGHDAAPVRLRAALAGLAPELGPKASWSDILQVNLAARLQALVDALDQSLQLRRHLGAVLHGGAPPIMKAGLQSGLPSGQRPEVLHRDHGMALRSAFAAVIAITACCLFWIVTAWPSGAAAPTMAAVFCCFFATQDDPVPGIRLFLHFTLLSIPISAFYLLVVLPSVHSFEMLALAGAPVFLLVGIYAGRPATTLQGMAVLFGVAGMLGLQDTGNADMLSFTNGMLAQLTGLAAAVLFTRLLRSVSTAWTARRLLHAGWDELVAMGQASRTPSLAAVSARMLDRIALLAPRIAALERISDAGLRGQADEQAEGATSAESALVDLRVGLNMALLREMQPRLERAGMAAPLQQLMRQLAQHYRRRRDGQAGQPTDGQNPLLACIDAMLRAVCAALSGSELAKAAAALASLRRDLFPSARPYQPVLPEEAR